MDKARGFDRDAFFRSRQKLAVGKQALHYVVMNPEVPERFHERRTALLAPGFMCGLSNMALLGYELTCHGYQVLTISHERPNRASEDIRAALEAYHEGKLTPAVYPVSLIPHSLGAINSVEALTRYADLPDAVHDMVHLAPAGYGGVTPSMAPISIAVELSHRPSSQSVRDAVIDALQYTRDSGTEMLGLIKRASRADVTEETRQLVTDGLPITALASRRDLLIHARPMTEGLVRAGVSHGYVGVGRAGHNAHLMFPGEVAEQVVATIDARYQQSSAA